MKNGRIFILLLIAGCLFYFLADGFAQSNHKIAVLDLAKVLRSYKKGERFSNQMQAKIQQKQKEINKSKQEALKLREELDKKKDTLDEKEKEKEQKKLAAKLTGLQEMVKESNQELKDMDQGMQEEIFKEIHKVVQDIARKEGYSLVIQSQGVILYNQGHDDITDKAINQLNKKVKE